MRLPIRAKLFVAMFLVSLVPMLVLIAATGAVITEIQQAAALREVTRSGELSRTVVDEVGQRVLATAEAVAVEGAVIQGVRAEDRTPLIGLSDELDRKLGGVSVAFVDNLGLVWLQNGPTSAYRDNLLGSLSALSRARQGEPSYSTEVGGGLGLGIRGFAPIVADGQVVGVVVVTQKVDDGFLATLREKTGLASFVVFANGSSAGARLDPAAVKRIRATRRPGTGTAQIDGHLASYFAWPLQDPGGDIQAFIGVVVPLTDLEVSQRELERLSVWASLCVAGLSVIAAWWMSRQIARPVERIATSARAIAGGARAEIPSISSGDELQVLSSSLQSMVQVLSEQTERLNFVVGHARCLLWQAVVDRSGPAERPYNWDIRMADEAAAIRLVPIARDDGQSYAAAWHLAKLPEDRIRMDEQAHAALEQGFSGYTQEFRCRTAEGEIRWLREDVCVESLGEGRWQLVGICTDVSELRAAQETAELAMRENHLILRSVADGIIVQSGSGLSLFTNDAAARMLGYEVDELVGYRLHALIHHTRADGRPYPEEECPIAGAARSGQSVRVTDDVFWRKDGTSFSVEYIANPIVQWDGSTAVVLTFQDVSERRAVERMKDEFISVVSHELRTPLTSIRGSLGLLANGVLGPVSEKGQRMLGIAVSNTDRLVRLINDILDIERMESGKVTLDERVCEASDLIFEAVEALQVVAQKEGVRLVAVPTEASVYADPDRIVQTLTNLIGNAIKFSPAGTTIQVAAVTEGREVRFSVRDQGRGVPADKIESIFGRFQQVDASDSREKGGSGLGLAICRSIVQQHGGKIWAESAPGEGSTFYFTLPALDVAPALPPPTQPAPTVLLFDDDDGIAATARAMFERQGYRVILANQRDDVLARLAAGSADVVLVDVSSASGAGWEMVGLLKEREDTRHIRVVIFHVIPPDVLPEPGVRSGRPEVDDSLSFLHRSAGRPATVLIVEDDADLAQVLRTLFESDNVRTVLAASGREAVRLSQEINPDLLVLDLVLPDGDGFSVVRWLRQQERLRSVPLVVYSARDLGEAERECLKLGRTEFYTKGRVTVEDFERRVLQVLDEVVPGLQEVS